MTDRAILFFSIVMILVFFYRIILSILLLNKKKYLVDEKFYISVFYCSLVSILVLFTDWLIVGIILVALLPIILTFYVSLAPSRKYWIINGWELTESAFINDLIELHPEFEKASYRINHFKISRKIKEKKTKLEFLKMDYKEKECLLKDVLEICKKKVVKANKKELTTILIYSLFIFAFLWIIIFTLIL